MQGLRITDTKLAENYVHIRAELKLNMKQQYHTVMRKTNEIPAYPERALICKTCNNLKFFLVLVLFSQVRMELKYCDQLEVSSFQECLE